MDFNNYPEDYPQLPRKSAQSTLQSYPNTGDRFNMAIPPEFTPKSAEEIDRMYKMGLIDQETANKLELGLTNNPYQGGAPKTLEEVDALYQQGKITQEQANQFELDITNNIPPYEQEGTVPEGTDKNNRPWQMPLLNTTGSDLSTELYSLGMNLGKKQGTPGKGLGIVGSAGAALLGGARDVLSGLGFQRSSDRFADYYKEQIGQVNYTPASQTRNENYLGGIPTGEQGGTFQIMADGGRFGNNSGNFDLGPYQGLTGEQIAQLTPEEKIKIREHYYTQSLPQNSYRNPDKYSYKMSDQELANYIKEQQAKDPYAFEGTGVPQTIYTSVRDGKPDVNDFFPVYTKPTLQTVSTPTYTPPQTNQAAAQSTQQPTVLDVNTGQILKDREQMFQNQQVPYQYSQSLEQFANSPEVKAKRQEQEQRIAQNKELLTTMSEEQKAEARSLKMTPMQYIEYKGAKPTMQEGGRFDGAGPGDPPTKEQIYQATLDYLNANPITTKKGEPLEFNKLQPIGGYAAPKMIGTDLLIPGVGTFKEGDYQVAPMPEGYTGLPVYIVNGKPVVADQKFNQEYYKMYKDPKLLKQDELYPIYGQGYPYKPQMGQGGRFDNVTPQYNVGETVKFMYGGKMVSGKIAKVENGKLFLE